MGMRVNLDAKLRELLGPSVNVYFQPPENLKLRYPCLIYTREPERLWHADNIPYSIREKYSMRYIDKDPESPNPLKLTMLPLCSHDRHYVQDNLHHDAYTIYY